MAPIRIIIGIIVALFLLTGCGEQNMKTTNKIATVETTLGTFKIELASDKAPLTTQNFIDLTAKGFYEGTKFHRIIKKFMIQGGDPLTKEDSKKQLWGTGGPGYEIEDEFDSSLSNVRGTISMANHGPDTGGSQFFINVVDNTYLDNRHTVFGHIVEGMNIIDKIGTTPTDRSDRPLEAVVIKKVRVE